MKICFFVVKFWMVYLRWTNEKLCQIDLSLVMSHSYGESLLIQMVGPGATGGQQLSAHSSVVFVVSQSGKQLSARSQCSKSLHDEMKSHTGCIWLNNRIFSIHDIFGKRVTTKNKQPYSIVPGPSMAVRPSEEQPL